MHLVALPAGAIVHRAFRFAWGYDAFNPGSGDTRFASIVASSGAPIPTLHAGVGETSALLETIFHDVHQAVAGRVIYEAMVRTWGLAAIRLPSDLLMVDLRHDALAALGLRREQLVATTAEHYPCTRQWAQRLHDARIGGRRPHGLLWHSRQAELRRPDTRHEVFVLWGDRAPSEPGSYPLAGPGVRNLTEGPGRLLLDRLAEQLAAVVEPADP